MAAGGVTNVDFSRVIIQPHKWLDGGTQVLWPLATGIVPTEKTIALEEEISSLKRNVLNLTSTNADLTAANAKLHERTNLQHLLGRVCEAAHEPLLSGKGLKKLFDKATVTNAYVLSIDLRRSTDLMLNAREPKLFAEFITKLANKLRAVILSRFGVFDKFTGDGILAFFPEFYSGEHAGLLAVEAAKECHEVFAEHYKSNRKCFTCILKNSGLGIGMDFGAVAMVQMSSELTVVGSPVVFACRLGGADAGQTLVNEPAYEDLFSKFSEFIDFVDAEIDFKHAGTMIVHRVTRNEKPSNPTLPDWLSAADPEPVTPE